MVVSGRKGEIAAETERLLADHDAMDLINNHFIPALDEVGVLFDQGKFFLPQLMASAEAARMGFDTIKRLMPADEIADKGKICVATVKGDIHDIGKNIVKMLLDNYGYTVFDLGRDVDPQEVLKTVRERDIKLVGLSALMTTTVVAMEETIKLRGGKVGHIGKMTNGMIKAGDVADLSVDAKLRRDTCRNHSATHLLQKALREVLGTHVEQAGSYQDGERTRFDFSHFAAMTPEELKKVEAIVNEKIAEKIDVRTDVMTVEEAKKTGAMALFGEKYGETVRVVSMGDFSKEFCGGTHVANTGDIVVFKIISESGVAAGVRRIEALTGDNVFAYYKKEEEELEAAAKAAKATPATLVEKIGHLMAELKALQSENESLKSKAAKEALGDVMDQVVEVKGVKLLAVSVDGVDMNGLRDLGDQLKGKLGEGVIVLASASDGKVNLVAMATDDAMAHGAHAGNLIKSIAGKVGGGGGGRPNMAQAGGKNPAGIPDAIAEAKTALEAQLA